MRRSGVAFVVSLTLLLGVAGAPTAQASSEVPASRGVEHWAPWVQGGGRLLPGVALATADLALFKTDSRARCPPEALGGRRTSSTTWGGDATNVTVTDGLWRE